MGTDGWQKQYSLLSLDQKEMIETFSKGTDPEFDNGFGMGLASLFNKYWNHLPHDFFESQVVSWGTQNL
jgi:hypothetical protein